MRLVVCSSYLAPSSSGLGHHPLKVAARVRIPLGLLSETGLAVSVGQCVHTAVVYNHGLDTLDPEHPVRMR